MVDIKLSKIIDVSYFDSRLRTPRYRHFTTSIGKYRYLSIDLSVGIGTCRHSIPRQVWILKINKATTEVIALFMVFLIQTFNTRFPRLHQRPLDWGVQAEP
jgi:low affinity Fe/Cu permease